MTDERGPERDWSEGDSRLFIDEGRYFVPERELQIETIGALIPPIDGPAHLVELCCGEGLLSRALLERFPQATVHAYDLSPTMLASAKAKAGDHAARLVTCEFRLEAADWRRPDFSAHAVVTSLAVHHLDGAQKQALFCDLFDIVAPGGVFVLADLVAPTRAAGVAIAADMWDEAVKERALALDGNLAAFQRFREADWNFYAMAGPDSIDKPSTLLDQLRWIEAAGFRNVDVHWMKAGHAIMSALRP
ncbi:MAG: class I SAM-dependent methyltransferase [Dongiaceae bacterium]